MFGEEDTKFGQKAEKQDKGQGGLKYYRMGHIFFIFLAHSIAALWQQPIETCFKARI